MHRRGWLHAAAHITGGGFPGNLLRQAPETCGAEVGLGTWPVPPLFTYLQKIGNVARDEMYRTFNMGIGMVLVIPAARLAAAQTLLRRLRERHYVIGQIVRGKHQVDYL